MIPNQQQQPVVVPNQQQKPVVVTKKKINSVLKRNLQTILTHRQQKSAVQASRLFQKIVAANWQKIPPGDNRRIVTKHQLKPKMYRYELRNQQEKLLRTRRVVVRQG